MDSSGTKSVQDLPEEILIKTFSLLDVKDAKSVAEVCSKWKAISSDLPIWKTYRYESNAPCFKNNLSLLSTFLKETPQIERFVINGTLENEEVLQILAMLNSFSPNLQELVLSLPDASAVFGNFPLGFSEYPALTRRVKSLTLSFENWLVFDPFSVNYLAVFKNLETIKVIGDKFYYEELVIFRKICPQVKNIYMQDNATCCKCVDFFSAPTKPLPLDICKKQIVGLKLIICPCQIDYIKSLLTLSNLKELCLRNGNVDKKGLSIISQLKGLEKLCLGGLKPDNKLDDLDLTNLHNLKRLVLTTELNDEGAWKIRAQCPKLEYLGIYEPHQDSLKSPVEKFILAFTHHEVLETLIFHKFEEPALKLRRTRFLSHTCEIDSGKCPLNQKEALQYWDSTLLEVANAYYIEDTDKIDFHEFCYRHPLLKPSSEKES